jgi:hypothetical protein
VRHCGHSTAVTRTGGTSLQSSRLQAVPLIRVPLSLDEKAGVYQCAVPVSPRIKAVCNYFFVRCRHVQQDRCTDDVRALSHPLSAKVVGSYSYSLSTPTYYIRPPNSPSWENSPLSSISRLPIPEYLSPVTQYPGASQNEGPIPFIPGGGLTRRILSNVPESWNIPTAALVQFVLEGNNNSDASLMAAVVAKVLSLDVQEWRAPDSWKQGLFGSPHDQTLYG